MRGQRPSLRQPQGFRPHFDDSARSGGVQRSRFVDLLGAPADVPLRVIAADETELRAHRERLATIAKKSGGKLIWNEDPA